MSLINIINESFDKRNKSILTESKDKKLSKQLHESLTDQDKGHIVTEIARLMDKSDADLEDVLYDLGWNYNDDDWVPVIGRFIDDDSPDLDAVDDFISDELGDDSLDIYDHVKRYKKYITDPEILKKYGKRPNYVTQLKTAFKRVDDTYDLSVLVDDLMYGFYGKTRKILASKGFTNFSSEPSTQNMMGKDFFWAEKDGVKYEGSYDFETELEDISDFVINSNATTRKDLFNELAEWYADFVLSTLEPMEDDEDDEDNDLDENIFIKKQKRKSQKLKETTNKSLHEYFDYGEAKDFDELGDMLDQSGDLIREAAEKLGFKDFEWEDSVQGPHGRSDFWITGDDGTRLHAKVDFSETWVTDLDEAIMLLDNLEWKDASDDSDDDDLDDTEEDYPVLLKQSFGYLLDASRELGLKDFDYDYDPSWIDTTLRYIDRDGNKRQAYFDSVWDVFFTNKEDAMNFLKSIDWKVIDDEDNDLDENIFIKKQKRKSQKLKEDTKKLYKYIVVNHFSPEDFYLVKSNHPVDENMFDAWNFLDVTDKHGKGTVIWNDEYIDFNESGNKSIADLDDEYREGVVRYLSDLEKNGNLDTIKDEYISFDDLEYDGYLTDFPAWLDPGDGESVVEEYMNDKTLKNSYLATMYSDYLENSYVDKDSSSAAAYIDIDDLTQYTDYEEFFDEDDD